MGQSQRIARNVMWLVFERGLQVAFGIASVALIARIAGPEQFGEFQYAQSLVLIASSFALICGNEVVVPRLVGDASPLAQHQLLAHAFGVRESAAVAGYLLLLVAIVLTGQDRITLDIAAILGLPILLREPVGAVRSWMQARTDSRPGVVFGLVALTARVLVVGILYWIGTQDIHQYAWAFALETLLMAVLLARYYFRHVPKAPLRFDRTLATRLLQDGTAFWVSMMLMLSARRVDQLLLKPHIPLSELGAYAACMQVLDNFMLLAAIVASTLAPLAIYAQPTLAAARRNVMRTAMAMAALGLAGGSLIALCAPWIVHLIYGSHYESAVGLMQVAAFASVLVFADAALSLLVVHLRKPRWLAEKWLVVLVTMVVVDLFMIPRYGALGAVYGYVAGNALAVVAGISFLLRTREPEVVEQAA